MPDIHMSVNAPGPLFTATVAPARAPLRNLTLLSQLVERSMNRKSDLPGMVCFSGYSGYGKSYAAAFVAANFRAYYVEARDTWTKKSMLAAILKQMGIATPNGWTVDDMREAVAMQLAKSGRPLIIDEMDYVVDRNLVQLVRSIYEGSRATIVLIGEEKLPHKLEAYEMFHNRILKWAQAEPCNIEEAALLAQLYSRSVTLAPDLLAHVVHETRGITRRVCINLDAIIEWAAGAGLKHVALADWGGRELDTGAPPRVRGR